jgi:hypothetical protein
MLKQTYNKSLFNRVHKRMLPLVENTKSASYFTITLTLLSLSFFGLFAIRPTIITVVSLYKSVEDLKKINIEYENKIGSLVRGQAEYEKIRKQIPLIQSAVPLTSSFHKLTSQLEDFTVRSDISINQLQVDGVAVSKQNPTDKLQKYNFSMITIGSYQNTYTYLQHLLNWKRLVSVNSLEFINEGSTTSGLLRVTIKGNAYYEP